MAGQKEYSMLFKLSAQLGKEFSSAFSAAQQQLRATQKEISDLKKVQSDISAYTKQQQAVDATSKKLSDLVRQHDNIQREIKETGTYSSDLENKLIDKERAIEKAAKALEQETKILKSMENSLQKAGVDTSNLSQESQRLVTQLEQAKGKLQSNQQELGRLAQKQREATEATKDFGNISATAFEAAGNALATAGIAAGLKAIYDEYKQCVSIAAEFHETMSTVEALSGASADEMAALTAEAKVLGATTKYTATESAQAMTYMGMAGWKAGEMLSGMDGVINLAAASGEDLATVADIVTDNLTAFGLKASDTARFADVLASAATNSNTSVSVMGETFKSSAALAGALGYSIEDVAVAVGLMANAGVKGSNAGTALKNIFGGLLEGITLTSEAFGEVEYSAVNADGTMKSFGETLVDLRGYFEQMTGAEQMQNANLIAGERAMSGFVSILNASDSDFQKLTDSINNSAGAAQKMADIKMDNLNGQLTLMNSAADALRTTIGEAFEPELRALAEIGTEILTGIQKFAEEHPVLLKSIIAITAEVGAFLLIYKSYQTVKSVMNTLTAVGNALKAQETAATVAHTAAVSAEAAATTGATVAQTGLNAAMLANPIGLVIAAIATLTTGIIALANYTKEYENGIAGMTATTRKQYYELQELNDEYEKACELYGETDERTLRLKYQVDELTDSYEANKKTVKELQNEVSELASEMENINSTYRDSLKAARDEETDTLALIQKLKDLSALSDSMGVEAQMTAIIDSLNEKYSELALTYADVTANVDSYADAMRRAAEQEYEARKKEAQVTVFNEAVTNKAATEDRMTDLEQNVAVLLDTYGLNSEDVSDEVRRLYSAVQAEIDDPKQNLTYDTLKALTEYVNRSDAAVGMVGGDSAFDITLGNTWEYSGELNEYASAIKEAEAALAGYNDQIEETAEAWGEAEAAAKAAQEALYVTPEGAVDFAFGLVKEDIDSLCASYDELYQAARESFEGQYKLWDTAAEYAEKDIGSINTALETQIAYWDNYNEDLNNLLSRAGDIEGLSELIATNSDNSTDSVMAISGMAHATDEELRQMVKNWTELQKQQSETADTFAKLVTNFDENLDELTQQMKDAVEELDLSSQAEQSAENMIDAYADEIRNSKGAAVAAANEVASAVAEVLSGTVESAAARAAVATANTATRQAAANVGTSEALTSGMLMTVTKSGQNPILMSPYGSRDYNAYASGTDGAEAGLALVGEHGPELMIMQGGERIYNAAETEQLLALARESSSINAYASGTESMAILSFIPLLSAMVSAEPIMPISAERNSDGGKIEINISPVFQIEGGSSGVDELESRVHDISDQLIEMVMERLDEIGIDAKRSVYS